MRTQAEISAEIKTLRELKPRIPRQTDFCDNVPQAIDAEIAVLEKGLDISEILERNELDPSNPDYFTDDMRDMAFDARLWLDGADLGKPSVCWGHYIL